MRRLRFDHREEQAIDMYRSEVRLKTEMVMRMQGGAEQYDGNGGVCSGPESRSHRVPCSIAGFLTAFF